MILGNPASTFFYERRFRFVRGLINDFRGCILDVGCGLYKVRPDAVGMDLKPWKHPDVVGSVFEIPFDDGRFDAVTMLELVEHITPARQHLAIHEIARVLRRGGICVISTPNLTRWWDKPYRIVWWVWERTIQREYLKDHIGMVRQEYTERLLRKHFFLVLSQRIGLLDRVYLCVKP